VRSGDLVVLTTDGVTDHIGSQPLVQLGRALEGVSNPELGAYRLLELATAGGAGDHLAVALART
jgi:serine/threonine protein phosphatase PrpC